MKVRKSRGPFVALATGLFLILSFNSVPSGSSVPTVSPPPPEEIAALEEIASWLVGPPGDLQAIRPADLSKAVDSQPLAFDLFRSYTDEASRRSFLLDLPYGDEIYQAAENQHLDALLVAAMVEVESSFKPAAVSPKGAVGLMQVLPSTGRLYGRRDLTDPKVNLEAGTLYFRSLMERFDDKLDLALAAYNAGPATVSRYGSVPPFRETREYVERVLSRYVDHHKSVWDASGATDLILLR